MEVTTMKSAGGTKESKALHERVRSQFGAAAAAYTASIGHRDPAMWGEWWNWHVRNLAIARWT
jgi:hypothetical protein